MDVLCCDVVGLWGHRPVHAPFASSSSPAGVPWQVLEGLAATEDSPGCTQTSTLVRQMSTASQGLRDLKAPTVTTSIARLIREDSSAPSVESPKGDALGLTSVAQDLCALSAAGL